jgi:hypothetical protein
MKRKIIITLESEFKKIHDDHRKMVPLRSAKVVLGSSVIRALPKKTKEKLENKLAELTATDLKKWTEYSFKTNFVKKVKEIKKMIPKERKVMKRNKRIRCKQKVNKDAHASKILALYCRELLMESLAANIINYKIYSRIEKLLFCPVDSKVIKKLREFKEGKQRLKNTISMKTMDKNSFEEIQDWLAIGAERTLTPRIWFDDVWVQHPKSR